MGWLQLFRRRRPEEAQLDSELQFHVDRLTEEKMAAGLPLDEARREALLEFGGREQVKEDLRDVHRMALIEGAIANLKSGVRLMRKSPSFSLAVVLTLALGIGANSAVFSAINAILLRPLPFPEGDELMRIHQLDHKTGSSETFVATVRLEEWNRLNTTFQAISGYYTEDVSETSGVLPERVTEALVAPRFLQVWGVAPALGRDFAPEEEHFGGPTAALISDRLWRRRFHADPGVLGKRLRLDQYSYTIVGVMPASFLFPDHDVDIWTVSSTDAPFAQSRDSTWFTAIGRLKRGVTVAQANANLASVQAQLGHQFPKPDGHLGVAVEPLKDTTVGGAGRSLWILFGSVSLLLLIACTNIAALLLARTTEREREISVRYSLGASRASIILQLLTECFVLAFVGAALGLGVAAAGAKAFETLARSLPRAEEVTLDWRIVAYTLASAVLATFLCGLFPALRGTRRSISSELAAASRTQVSTRSPWQWLLAGIQVALAVTLLVGAGLLLRSFEELGRVSAGFDPSHVLTLRISGNWGETAHMDKLTERINRTLNAIRTIPGVRAAATSAELPGINNQWNLELAFVEAHTGNDEKIITDVRVVSNGYFATLGIPVLTGEGCGVPPAKDMAVVNRSFANTYLNGLQPVGRHLKMVSSPFPIPPAEIRGVVADAREEGLDRAPGPTVYWCLSAPDPSPNFLIQTAGTPTAMGETLRRKIHEIDPARSVFGLSPLEEHIRDSFAETRLRTILLTLFAITAVSLACIGLYGSLSYFVTVRRREVGLRLALGAVRSQIVRQFLWKGVGVTAIGCAAGLALAGAFAHVLAGMLYGVSVTDAATLSGVPILVLVVAALACLVPAVRAARVEPMDVLRDE